MKEGFVRIDDAFRVDAPAEVVWTLLADPERVAAVLPGAEITRNLGDGAYEGAMSVKMGPLAATYRGTVAFEFDEGARAVVLRVRGHGVAGVRNAEITVTSRVAAVSGNEAKVAIGADIAVAGLLARLGHGMIRHVSKRMIREFAGTVAREIARERTTGVAPRA